MPSWTAAEATKWEAELQARLAATKCERCGSNKVTQTLRGKPYMAYVDWYVPRESNGRPAIIRSGLVGTTGLAGTTLSRKSSDGRYCL